MNCLEVTGLAASWGDEINGANEAAMAAAWVGRLGMSEAHLMPALHRAREILAGRLSAEYYNKTPDTMS